MDQEDQGNPGYSFGRCHGSRYVPTYMLFRANLDGTAIRQLSFGEANEWDPSVLHDGRIIYTRWEYTDKPLWRAQGLWTVNPDGTSVSTFWGNQSVWPDLLKDARAIPGSHRVMFTGSAHHNWFSGSVGIIDPTKVVRTALQDAASVAGLLVTTEAMVEVR